MLLSRHYKSQKYATLFLRRLPLLLHIEWKKETTCEYTQSRHPSVHLKDAPILVPVSGASPVNTRQLCEGLPLEGVCMLRTFGS